MDFWDKEVKFQAATVSDVMGEVFICAPGIFAHITNIFPSCNTLEGRKLSPSRTVRFPDPIFQDNSTMHALEVCASHLPGASPRDLSPYSTLLSAHGHGRAASAGSAQRPRAPGAHWSLHAKYAHQRADAAHLHAGRQTALTA